LRDSTVGLARIGLDSEEVDALLRENRQHIFLSMGLMMGIGLLAIGFHYRNQNRHLRGIQNMNERLQQLERLSSMGQLAAGVAHEIRNPLNAIGLAIQRIQREYSPPGEADSDKEFHKLIFTVREEIKRLNVIIEDFLSMSRRIRLALRPQSISEFLERVVILIQEEANSRRINIQTHWDEPAMVVTIDESRMRQALLNLIKNAFESISGEGTVTLSVKPHSKKWVRIQLADTGVGIAPGDLERIFSADYTTKEKGLGLGLPIAHEIIRAHGGEVRVRSEVGRGTTFEILLPRSLETTR
jgi:signal transduction histidine kinase